MATLDEVPECAIEGYDPEAFYDGKEQIVKESLTAFCRNPLFLANYPAPEIVARYRRDYVGWYESLEEMAADNIFNTWESDDGYYFRRQ